MNREQVVRRLLKKNNMDEGCCSSCHEDYNLGYCDLLEMYFTKNRMAFVCCKVANAWDKLVKKFPKYHMLIREDN